MPDLHRSYFNAIAPAWPLPGDDELQLASRLKRFDIREGDWILDLGSGKGRLTAALRQRAGHEGKIVALDSAQQMLLLGAARFLTLRAQPLCSDAAHLACRTASFNKVICLGTWPHFVHPQRVMQEVLRVLKAGGQFLIWHTCSSRSINRFHARLDGVVARDRLLRASELARHLEECGFILQREEDRPHSFWVQAQKPDQISPLNE